MIKIEQYQKDTRTNSLEEGFKEISSSDDEKDQNKDYEYVPRSLDVSIKYFYTLLNKTIHRLNQNEEINSISNIPIVCSYADMDFKFSPKIHTDWIRRLSEPNINLGYPMFENKTKDIIISRLKKSVYPQCNGSNLLAINSMLTLYHLVVTSLTQPDDQVFIFTPTYYRFLYTLQQEKRPIVEYELKMKQTPQGLFQYFFDLKELEQLFDKNKIKLVVFANPHNPAGKLWKKEQLKEISMLVKKHNCLVFSDDIFCQCVQNPSADYTSLLNFQEIHQNLIWASSFGKAYNCSGNSFSYAIIPNTTIRQKLQNEKLKLALFPKIGEMRLLQSCFTVGQEWRTSTIHYVRRNYEMLTRQFKKRELNLGISTLQSGFLVVIDFLSYKWSHPEIKSRLQAQNIFPTYLDICYVNRQKESVSSVRINLAINQRIMMQLIDRIEKVVKNKINTQNH